MRALPTTTAAGWALAAGESAWAGWLAAFGRPLYGAAALVAAAAAGATATVAGRAWRRLTRAEVHAELEAWRALRAADRADVDDDAAAVSR